VIVLAVSRERFVFYADGMQTFTWGGGQAHEDRGRGSG